MQTAEEIYQKYIKSLSYEEKLRLIAMIVAALIEDQAEKSNHQNNQKNIDQPEV